MARKVDPYDAPRCGRPFDEADVARREAVMMISRSEQLLDLTLVKVRLLCHPNTRRETTTLRRESEHEEMQPTDRPTENSSRPLTHAAKPNLRTDRVDTAMLLAEARHEWDDLASLFGSYFQTPAWVEAWHDVLSADSRMESLVATDDDGRIVGMLHIASMRRNLHRKAPIPLRYTGLAGSGPGAGDHLGPLAPPDVGEGLLAELGQRSGSPVMLEHLAPAWRTAAERAGFRLVVEHVVPLLDLTEGYEQVRSKKVRKEMRRRWRRMADEGVDGEWLTEPSEVETHLVELAHVHLARWREKGEPGLFSDTRLAFLRRLCQLSSDGTGPLLHLLRDQDRTVVGALLAFKHNDVFATYKTGWDPSVRHLGVGLAMHDAAIERASGEGCRAYDFLRGTTSHKYSLGGSDAHDVTMLRGRGVTARLLRKREEKAAR